MPKFDIDTIMERHPKAVPVQAPVKGQIIWTPDVDDVSMAPVIGTPVSASEPLAHIQTFYGMEEIVPVCDGRIVAVCAKQGDKVAKGEIIAFIRK